MKTAFIIVDEASKLERNMFEMVVVLLKDLHCFSKGDSLPRFVGISVVFSRDYLLPLLVVPSHRWVEYEDANGRHVNVRLLDELQWAFRISNHVKVLMMTAHVRRSSDSTSEGL